MLIPAETIWFVESLSLNMYAEFCICFRLCFLKYRGPTKQVLWFQYLREQLLEFLALERLAFFHK
jgi:hypothetical protein